MAHSASPSVSPGIKAVSISDELEEITLPSINAAERRQPLHKSISSKRLRGRLPVSPSLAASVVTKDVVPEVSLSDQDHHANEDPSAAVVAAVAAAAATNPPAEVSHYRLIIDNCSRWLENERIKRGARRERRRNKKGEEKKSPETDASSLDSADESLDVLEALLQQHPPPPPAPPQPRMNLQRRRSSGRIRRSLLFNGTAPSDTEYASDGEALVPACEEWLKTSEEIGMDEFKLEVLKLAHTLRCKGWRRVDLGRSGEVGVERISGALTNAVYMVSPPANVPPSTPSSTANSSTTTINNIDGAPRKTPRQPPKLLLRIYGPQVEHLIDRATELSILRRLAKQEIGPRLLGTFLNGRFEEFFASRTLTKEDIRLPETSQHIAMRLKELHAGIDLLPGEREQGPIVWKNWEKWTPLCRDVIASLPATVKSPCGTSFDIFETYVGKYRDFLQRCYGGEEGLRGELVFAHNDAQYGNILRLENSPSLSSGGEAQPHRRLVVIDFEYASANTPGFEFANHFCEWTADYHCSTPHVMDQLRYPSRREQRNFIAAYVDHWARDDGDCEAGKEKVVERLLEEARLWRAASSAQWCAWGIVQAKGGVAEGEEEEQEEFDYFAYARQRGLLFWGDLVELGLVGVEELEGLAEGLGGQVKRISEAEGKMI